MNLQEEKTNKNIKILMQRTDKEIELPEFAYEHDAAIDLRSAEDVSIKPKEKGIVKMLIKNPRVLIVDDNEDVLVAAKLLLKQQVGYIQTEKDPEKRVRLSFFGRAIIATLRAVTCSTQGGFSRWQAK